MLPVFQPTSESNHCLLDRFDVIAGLKPKQVVLPGRSRAEPLCCIGEDEMIPEGKRPHFLPSKPLLALPIILRVMDLNIQLDGRAAMEARLRESVARNMKGVDVSQAKVLSRVLRIGELLGGALYVTFTSCISVERICNGYCAYLYLLSKVCITDTRLLEASGTRFC